MLPRRTRSGPSQSPPRTVALVMGHPAVRVGLTELLIGAGFDVIIAAATSSDGYTAITQHLPDAAVIDDHLPDGHGLDLCRALTAHAPHIPVIIYATILTPDDQRQAHQAGAAAIIAKTIYGHDLLHALITLAPVGAPPREDG